MMTCARPVGVFGTRASPRAGSPAAPARRTSLFVLGNYPLHLHEQARLGVVVNGGRVGEADGDAEAGEARRGPASLTRTLVQRGDDLKLVAIALAGPFEDLRVILERELTAHELLEAEVRFDGELASPVIALQNGH